LQERIENTENQTIGIEIYDLIKKLFPICRSITGNGVRETLEIIKKHLSNLEIHQVPSGTKVFDWTIPKEWNIKDAFIKNSKGEKIIDFKNSNLHVLNYSTPINTKISLKELKNHIFTIPDFPDWIPYRTSYYQENWGFCMSHKQFEKLEEDEYEVFIDSSLDAGNLTYGELFFKGETDEEVLFSSYVCHPSMCNDNLSGITLLTYLAKQLENKKLNFSYRFLFIPETIGAITWLSKNENHVKKIKHGLVATCVGDSGILTYKKTRDGKAIIDQIVEKVLKDSGEENKIIEFFPSGSDERQFSSPGFNLSVGSLTRTLYGKFPEYHTSADNLDFVEPKYLVNTFEKYLQVIFILENNLTFLNLNPKCEPQLGKRELYQMIGGLPEDEIEQMAIFWMLNLSDGKHSMLEISIRSGIKFNQIKQAADALLKADLIKVVEK